MTENFDEQKVRGLFSKNLKLIRKRQRFSQLALSSEAGFAHNFINDIENGKKWVSANTIAKLANALDVEPGEFFQSNPLASAETKKIQGYLDEINERFSQALGEIKEVYLSGIGKNGG